MIPKLTTKPARLVQAEALRYRALYRLYPDEQIYEDIYVSLLYAAQCLDEELKDANRR